MKYGYNGKILRIDLTSKNYYVEEPKENFYRTYWGGRAIGLYYMLKEMKPKTDPLSPDNLLIFAPSVITGTPVLALPRYTVCAKSPLTGTEGEAEAGGWWGPELKNAGFDAIVIKGASDKPVYLWIKDGNVEIRDASHLWGKDTGDVQDMLAKELNDSKIRIAQIGKGSENLVRFGNIVNELGHFNGRCGLGAVMGSKKLKAIAVKATQKINIYDAEKVKGIAKQLSQRIMENPYSKALRIYGTPASLLSMHEGGFLPSYNWTSGHFEGGEKLSAENINKTILKKTEGCYACAIRCKRVAEVNTDEIKVDPKYAGPEYETIAAFGSSCGVSDLHYIAKANELCNRYTIDTISSGMTIAFAMNCYEEGLLTKKDTDGIELKFGNKQAILQLIEKIANQEPGIGALLAQGSYAAAKKIGKNALEFTRHVKGQELAMHDPRVKVGVGLQYAVADYGSDHMKSPHDPFFKDKESPGVTTLKGLGILEPVSPTDLGHKKVALFKTMDIYWSLMNLLGVCVFGYVPRSLVGSMDDLLEIIRATTGWDATWYELMQVGERSINMARIFNKREGFSSKDDVLPEVFYNNFKKGALDGKGAISREDFAKALKLRYELMGWNQDTGFPTNGKLIELGLDWLVE